MISLDFFNHKIYEKYFHIVCSLLTRVALMIHNGDEKFLYVIKMIQEVSISQCAQNTDIKKCKIEY